jgi:signal transduction histidine kinase
MNRSWRVWSVFALGLLVATGALAEVSRTVLRLDREGAQARRQAVVEENVRLALWRMDAALSLFIARENLRPFFEYRPFIPIGREWTDMLRAVRPEEEVQLSPLATAHPEYVRLYFEVEPDGVVSSPQVPTAVDMTRASRLHDRDPHNVPFDAMAVDRAMKDLERLTPVVATLRVPGAVALATPRAEDSAPLQGNSLASQTVRNNSEYASRAYSATNGVIGYAVEKREVGMPTGISRGWAAETLLTPDSVMMPVWKNGELFLIRSINASGQRYLQGCWVEWPALSQWLQKEVKDLLPNAHLEAAPGAQVNGERRLAALPVLLIPGSLDVQDSAGGAPVELLLSLAWGALAVVALAIGLLLRGTLELSERRGAFVSAVTHELRTPLTTFRMYTEMLGEGMVPSPEQQQTYLSTLRREAERLSHLVENVLSYSRIEERRSPGRIPPIELAELMGRVEPRLRERAEQAQFVLTVEADEAPAGTKVRLDVAAAEQILLNLVDNACKYAAEAQDRRIQLRLVAQRRRVLFVVRDHGPGIPAATRRRLFQPFSKSASQAAVSAPGVGLGLALCRQLARSRRGDLRYLDTGEGAEFTLTARR